jgi:hypothetical protein
MSGSSSGFFKALVLMEDMFVIVAAVKVILVSSE